ncbi:hypothetical protein IGJ68_000939 [Enterococcus sp. DIV0564]
MTLTTETFQNFLRSKQQILVFLRGRTGHVPS